MSPTRGMSKKRWRAVIVYRTDVGLVDVEHFFEEIDELHVLVERGPSWFAIDHIRIDLNGDGKRVTIEEALAE